MAENRVTLPCFTLYHMHMHAAATAKKKSQEKSDVFSLRLLAIY